jgi:hypothetical protein
VNLDWLNGHPVALVAFVSALLSMSGYSARDVFRKKRARRAAPAVEHQAVHAPPAVDPAPRAAPVIFPGPSVNASGAATTMAATVGRTGYALLFDTDRLDPANALRFQPSQGTAATA